MKWITVYRYACVSECYHWMELTKCHMKYDLIWRNVIQILLELDTPSLYVYDALLLKLPFHYIVIMYYPIRNRLKKEIKDGSKSVSEVSAITTYQHVHICSVVIV